MMVVVVEGRVEEVRIQTRGPECVERNRSGPSLAYQALLHGFFCKLEVLLLSVLVIRALLSWRLYRGRWFLKTRKRGYCTSYILLYCALLYSSYFLLAHFFAGRCYAGLGYTKLDLREPGCDAGGSRRR